MAIYCMATCQSSLSYCIFFIVMCCLAYLISGLVVWACERSDRNFLLPLTHTSFRNPRSCTAPLPLRDLPAPAPPYFFTLRSRSAPAPAPAPLPLPLPLRSRSFNFRIRSAPAHSIFGPAPHRGVFRGEPGPCIMALRKHRAPVPRKIYEKGKMDYFLRLTYDS